MNNLNNLLPLPVLLPMLGAALTLLLGRRPRLQRAVSIITLVAVSAVAGALVWITDTVGVQALWVGAWAPLGVVLVADRLSALMLLLTGREPTSGSIERPGGIGLGRLGGTAVIMQHPESQVLGTRVADDVVCLGA